MRTSSSLFWAVAPVVACFFSVACSSSSTPVTKADSGAPHDAGGDSKAPTTDSGGPAGDSSVATDSAAGGDSAMAADTAMTPDAPGTDGSSTLSCAAYCSELMTNCTGAEQQFPTNDSCMTWCATYPVGTAGDTSGDTLGCRTYHGGAPAMALPTTHCPHAGPNGGDGDPNGTTGTCGEACEAFCNAAIPICMGQPMAFANTAACMTECKTFKADTASYNISDTATNDLGCRTYHLSAAAESSANAVIHCPHIRAQSAVCTM
jgi:hypothetical protein